jgi:hypothetical protein
MGWAIPVSSACHTFSTKSFGSDVPRHMRRESPIMQLKWGQSAGNGSVLLGRGVWVMVAPLLAFRRLELRAAIKVSCEYNCFFGCIA